MNEDTRVLSVIEAVRYIDSHYYCGEFARHEHLFSESLVRRLLKRGVLPASRTTRGHLGVKVSDVEAWLGAYMR